MLRHALALLVGEALLLGGLACVWYPVALVAAGGQLIYVALTREAGGGA